MNDHPVTSKELNKLQNPGAWANQTRIPASRIRYYAAADASLIEPMQLGVLLVMACWSGPSVMSFRHLMDVISRLDPLEKLEIVVVDADGCPAFYELPAFKGDLHGYGEVAWIKDGVIQCTSGRGFNPSCYEPNTKALLESLQA